jgi:ribosomal protein L16 Arg81 hydroxylase
MIRRLRDLVAPLSEQEFLDSFSQKRRLVVKTKHPERAVSLLPWATINHLIDAGVMPSSKVRVSLQGTDFPELMYRRGPEGQLRPDALQQLAAQGASILLVAIDKYVPEIATLADAIERRMGYIVHVNCYITFGTTSAFKPHYDIHDVLAFQVHGAKRWRGYGVRIAHPVTEYDQRLAIAVGKPTWDELIEPGDILYVPRGEIHDAVGEVKPSVHLTVGIRAPNGIDLMNWMAKRAQNNAVLRMDVSRTGDKATLRKQDRILKRHVHEHIDRLSIDAFFDDADEQRSPRARLNFGFDGALTSEAWLAPTPRRRIAFTPAHKGESEVTIGRNVIRLSAVARRALNLLLEEDGLSFAALAERLAMSLEDSGLREAIVQLVAKGLVAVEPEG